MSIKVQARSINGQMHYYGEDGKEYSAAEVRQRNTLTPDSGKSIPERIAGFFSGESESKPTSVDDYFDSTPKKVDVSDAQSGYTFFKNTSADDNQKTANAARVFDIPEPQLLMSAQETQKEAVQKAETPEYDFMKLAQEAPKLYSRLKDPLFVAISHDDIDNLQAVESVGTQIANAFELTQKQNQLNDIDFKALNEGKKFDELDEKTKEERRKLISRINTLQSKMPKGFFTLSNVAGMAAGLISDFSEAAKYAAGGALAGAAAGSLIPVVGTTAGAAFGLSAGGKVGLARAGQVRSAAEAYRRQIKRGKDVEDAQRGARWAGAFGAIVNYPFGASILRARLIDTATKTGVLKQIGVNSAEQSFLGAVDGFGKSISDKEADQNLGTWTAEDAYNIAGGAATMAFMGTLLSTPGYAWAGLHELGKKIDVSNLKRRNPEAMKSFVDETVPGDISIDSDRVMDYLSKLDEDQAASVLKRMGVSVDDLEMAVQTGDKIHMTTGQFMNLEREEREAFYADVSMNDMPSAREVQEDVNDGPLEDTEENLAKTEVDVESIERETQDYQNERTQEINDEVESDRTYLASNLLENKPNEYQKKDSLEFNLQLFGHKTAKTLSDEYRSGKLTAEAEAEFEKIALKYGYSSGDEMAKDILRKRSKEEEKTARVQQMISDTKKENGTDEEGISARAELNDDNISKLESEAESMRKQANLEDMEATEDTDAETISKNIDSLDQAVETVKDEKKKQNLKERLSSLRKELNEKWENKLSETRKEKNQKISDVRTFYKEKLDTQKEKYKGKLKDQKEKYEEKLQAQKEEYQQKRQESEFELRKKRRETVDAYNILLKEIREETKDTRARRAARMGTLKVKDAKAQARYNISRIPQSKARDFRRLRAMAKKENAIAEKLYRKGVNRTLPTYREASATKGTDTNQMQPKRKPGEKREEQTTTAFTTENPDWNVRNAVQDDYLAQAIHHKNRAILLSAMAQEAIKVNDRYAARVRKIHKLQVQLGKDRKAAIKGKNTISKNELGYNQLGFLLERFGVPAKGFKPVFELDETMDEFANRMSSEGISMNEQLKPKRKKVSRSKRKDIAVYDAGFAQQQKEFDAQKFDEFIEELNGKLGAARIPDWIRKDQKKYNFNELTESQANDFVNTLDNIKKMLREENQMLSDKKRRDLNDVADKMSAELDENPNRYRPQDEKKKSIGNVLSRLWHDQMTMDTLIHILAPNAKELRSFFIDRKQYLDGLESTAVAKYGKKYKDIMSKYSKKELRDNYNKKIYLESMGLTATKQQLIAIALNLGNSSNREKLLTTKPIDFQDANGWNLKNIMDELEEHLDKKDWETVQQLWDLNDELKPMIIEHEMRVSGFAPTMIEPEAFTVRCKGEQIRLRGGWVQLRPDFRDANAKAGMEEITTEHMMKNPAGIASTNHSFTKERTNARYSISLEPGNVINYIMDAVHDYYFRDYVADARRLIDPKGKLYQKIYEKGGKAAVEDFKNYLLSVAGTPDKKDVGEYGVNAMFAWMKKSAAFSSIAFNFGVMAQNFANVFLYSGAVKGFNSLDVATGLLKYGMFNSWLKSAYNWRGFQNYIQKELSPYMLERYNRPELTLRAFENNVIGGQQSRFGEATDAVAEFSGKLMWFTDSLVSIPMWLQARDKKLKETGNMQEAIQYADTLIRRVNGSPNKSDNSRFMQAKSSTAYGMLNTFMGFFNAEANRWMRELYDVTGRDLSTNIRNIPSFLAFATAHMLLFSLASNLLMFKEPNEDQDWGDFILAGALEEPVQNFPVFKDILPSLIERSLGGESYAYRPPISFSLPAQALSAGGAAVSYLNNDDPAKDDQKFETMMEQTTRLLAQVTKMPKVLSNVFWNAYDYDQNNITEWQAADFIRRRAKGERE